MLVFSTSFIRTDPPSRSPRPFLNENREDVKWKWSPRVRQSQGTGTKKEVGLSDILSVPIKRKDLKWLSLCSMDLFRKDSTFTCQMKNKSVYHARTRARSLSSTHTHAQTHNYSSIEVRMRRTDEAHDIYSHKRQNTHISRTLTRIQRDWWRGR